MNKVDMDLARAVGLAIVFACCCIFLLQGCDAGWTICGWEVK
jgi:hypothetical protein